MNSTVRTDAQLSDDVELDDQEQLESGFAITDMEADTTVRIAKEQYSAYEMLRREKQGRVLLAPVFQRNDVWDDKQRAEFIESVLMGIPIPPIYLFEDETGTRQVVDGRQRITTFKGFIGGEFKLEKLTILAQHNGKKFSQLAPLLQGKIEDYQLNTYVIQPPTPESMKFNIFERVNRSSTQLNKQEIRHALYQGHATALLKKIAESEAFKLATGNSIQSQRMRDHYIILRFIGFYIYCKGWLNDYRYDGDSDAFLATAMKDLNAMEESSIEAFYNDSVLALTTAYGILGKNCFRFCDEDVTESGLVNAGLYEMQMFVCLEGTLKRADNSKLLTNIDYLTYNAKSSEICGKALNTTPAFEQRCELVMNVTKERL
ncbi:MAG: hypothetical protein ACI8WB_005419 [Phenylobacterium sp.]|jgi:hypothetical protein